MDKKTLEQLRAKRWLTRDAAVKELRRNGFGPKGDDYELRGVGGVFRLCDLTADDVPPQQDVPLNTGRRRPAMERIKKAAPPPPPEPEVPPASMEPPEPPAMAEPVVEPTEGLFDAPVAEAPEEAPTVPATIHDDMSVIDPAGGPYALRVAPEHVIQSSANHAALEASRKLGKPVQVIGPGGAIVRTIDARAVKTSSRGAPVRVGVRNPDSKRSRCATLLLRPEGATATELERIVGRKVRPRFIQVLARLNQASMETVGEARWRLVKRD